MQLQAVHIPDQRSFGQLLARGGTSAIATPQPLTGLEFGSDLATAATLIPQLAQYGSSVRTVGLVLKGVDKSVALYTDVKPHEAHAAIAALTPVSG